MAITNSTTVYTEPTVAKPSYLAPYADPIFNTTVMRIADDAGNALTTLNTGAGTWGTLARHIYSKIQPWNSDGSLICIANANDNGTPRQLYLDGNTYRVLYGKPEKYYPRDDRWHPSLTHPNTRIAVMDNSPTDNGMTLEWYDIFKEGITRGWRLPFAVDSIGSGEGNVSRDGQYILLSENNENNSITLGYRMFLVNMVQDRIGPAYDLAADGQMRTGWGLDWVSVSASGKYAVVMYDLNGIDKALRVFDIDTHTLALSPRPLTLSYQGMVGSPQDGFIYSLGHTDLAINPFDNNEDVIIGVENCGNVGKSVPSVSTVNNGPVGQLILVRLRDGQAMSLDDPTNEAGPSHISCRNTNRPAWCYVSYYYGNKGVGGERFADEVVAVRLDGSGTVERLAHQHSDYAADYYAEPMAVPNQDGGRIIFASNWGYNGTGGIETNYQDFVINLYT